MDFIPYGRQNIIQEDEAQVLDTLKSEFLTQGPKAKAFAEQMAAYTGASYGLALNSATSALHLACLALGLESGDVLWTSPITFVASANCALYCAAKVDFVDIDPRTYNISVAALEEKLAKAKAINSVPKVLVVVHFAGQSCEMKAIKILCEQYGVSIIEDASHAVGADYLNKKVGCCEYSDISVFSLHPVKIITTGEGGLALTNDKNLHQKMILCHSHGVTRNEELMTEPSHGPWYYEQIDLGFNYRMTDLQAALGLSQLKRADQFVARRRALAKQYFEMLSDCSVTLPYQHPDSDSSYHLFPIVLELENRAERKQVRKSVFVKLREANIGVNVHYIPVHTQPYYQNLGFHWGDFPNAESYYFGTISLPLHHGMTDKEQIYIVQSLQRALNEH
tara:strand:- start:45185 stop:46363 length:1179 start_codon:yes stop_codon:yes gene_type:complete